MTAPPAAAKIASAAAKIVEAQGQLYEFRKRLRPLDRREAERIHAILGRALQDLAGEQ